MAAGERVEGKNLDRVISDTRRGGLGSAGTSLAAFIPQSAILYFFGADTLSGEEAIRYLAWSLSSAPKNKFALASSP